MTKVEFLKSKEYRDRMNEIKNYSEGFEFVILLYNMTKKQRCKMRIVIQDAIREGLIEPTQIRVSLSGNITEVKYRRL
ncbi:MAG: hypothetical protein ACLTBR_03275 [Anaerostipes sp.]|uniref:hypothetical protein n=1 Tax=Anaerostipes sp. TaxID=1872530 RepID=UPI003992AA27